MAAERRQEVVAKNKRRDRSWFIVMSGMVKKRDERVGKGEDGVRITPGEASYMRDWRLTWRPVCDRKALTEKRNTKTKFPGEQDISHKFPTVKEPRRTNTSMVHGHPSRQLRYTDSQRKYTIDVCCTGRVSTEGVYALFRNGHWEMNVNELFNLVPVHRIIVCTS
jgi:hypothetical protein